MTSVVGLDLSLTATGVATADGQTVLKAAGTVSTDRANRLTHTLELRRQFTKLVESHDLIVVEDLPLSVRHGGVDGGRVQNLFEMVTYDAAGSGHSYAGRVAWITPATLKKFATGRGNAGKPQVLAEAIRRLGYLGHDDNEADAMWLRHAGLHHLGETDIALPKGQTAALDKVQWPMKGQR